MHTAENVNRIPVRFPGPKRRAHVQQSHSASRAGPVTVACRHSWLRLEKAAVHLGGESSCSQSLERLDL